MKKPQYKLELLTQVAELVVLQIKTACFFIRVKTDRDRIEIEYRPLLQHRRLGPFGLTSVDLAGEKIDWLMRTGFFKNRTEDLHWGPLNKNAIHSATGIPVDLRKVEQ